MKKQKQKEKRPAPSLLRKGDRVIAISGNERGRMGQILGRRGDRVAVEGLNMRKRHIKPTQENPKPQIVEMEGTMHISNVRPCSSAGKAIKLRVRTSSDGAKELIYLEEGEEKLYRALRKGKKGRS